MDIYPLLGTEAKDRGKSRLAPKALRTVSPRFCYLAHLCLHVPLAFSRRAGGPHGIVVRIPVLLDQGLLLHYDLILTNDVCGDPFPNESVESGLSPRASGDTAPLGYSLTLLLRSELQAEGRNCDRHWAALPAPGFLIFSGRERGS